MKMAAIAGDVKLSDNELCSGRENVGLWVRSSKMVVALCIGDVVEAPRQRSEAYAKQYGPSSTTATSDETTPENQNIVDTNPCLVVQLK